MTVHSLMMMIMMMMTIMMNAIMRQHAAIPCLKMRRNLRIKHANLCL